MKKNSCLLAMTFIGLNVFAQTDPTICHTSSTEKFAMFASNKKFNSMHLEPLSYTHISDAGGKMIKIKTDGAEANAYLLEAKAKTNNWIFVFQEWWGLNDNIKREAENLYKDLGNVNVLALDMYDGKLATTRDDAGKFMGEFKQDRGDAIVKGALAYVGASAKIGTIGWCFGGGQSMQAALNAGKQAAACVIYYGMPEENLDRLKGLDYDVLDIVATLNHSIHKHVISKVEQNIT